MEALSQHHPHVMKVIETPAPFSMSVQTESSGVPNLYIKDSSGDLKPLYPATKPTAGLNQVLAQMKDIRGTIVCHYGFGLGLHAVEIVKALAPANIVVLFEAYPALFKAALAHVGLAGMLAHPNVRLVVGNAPDFFEFLSGDPPEMFASVSHRAIRFDRAVSLAPSWYRNVSAGMARFNHYHMEKHATLAKAGTYFLKNRFRNLLAMSHARPVEEMAGRFSKTPAVLVASGPSLSKNIDRLKTLKGRALLIAADSAVGPLAEKGIVPDLVVSLEYTTLGFEKLTPFYNILKNAGLVFSDQGTFEVPNYLPFKARFFAFSGVMYQEFFNRILQTSTNKPLEQSQSVIHLAMHVALQAECDPIIFTGLDLAFDGGRDHAEGTVLHWGNRQKAGESLPRVPDIHGRMVPTHAGFLNMLATCEKMIREVPHRTWIDATEGGAKIQGTRIMPLEAAAGEFCSRTIDEPFFLKDDSKPLPAADIAGELAACREEIFASLAQNTAYFKCTDRIDEFLAKNEMPAKGPAAMPAGIRNMVDETHRILSGFKNLPLRRILASFVTGERFHTIRDHRARLMAAEASKDEAAVFIRAHEMQKAAQKMWREGFDLILGLLQKELEAFEAIAELEAAEDAEKASKASLMTRAALYFKYDYLWLVEQCLDKMPPETVVGEFYRGAIRLKRGDVVTGLGLMNSAVQQKERLGEELQRIVQAVEDEWLSAEGPETFQAVLRKRFLQMGPSEKVLKTLWPKDADAMNRILSENPLHPERLEMVDAILSDWDPVKEKLPEWWAVKARLLSIRGLPAEGIAAVETALQTSEGGNPRWLALLARLLIETGRADEGISKLEEAVAMDPRTAVLWEEIGDALTAGNDYDGARASYEKCLLALPNRIRVLKKIGDCYSAAGHAEAARMAYDQFHARQGNVDTAKNRNR